MNRADVDRYRYIELDESCVACELCSARHLPIYLSVYLSTAGSPPQPQPQVAGVAAAGVAAGGAEAPPLGREASVESAPPTYLASSVVALSTSAPLVITPSSAALPTSASSPPLRTTAGVLVDHTASAAGEVVIVVADGTWVPASGGAGGGPIATGVVVTGTPVS